MTNALTARRISLLISGAIALAMALLPATAATRATRAPGTAAAIGVHLGAQSNASATSTALLVYGGGAVVTSPPRVYLIFWGSWGKATANSNGDLTFSNDPYNGAPWLQEMYKGLGTNGELWSGVMTQYCRDVSPDATSCPNTSTHVAYPDGHTLANVYYDNRVIPTSPTKQQIAAEAVFAAGIFGNPANAQFVIASPTGFRPDGFNPADPGWCAWHNWVSSPLGAVVYTNLPYVMDSAHCGSNMVNPGAAGALDGYTLTASHEYAESITDPILSWGWLQPGTGNETGDMCVPVFQVYLWPPPVSVRFSTGTFVMTQTWSNDGAKCEGAHAILPLYSVAPNLVGDTLTQAGQALTAAGLVMGTKSSKVDCNNLGLVISQSPSAGTRLVAGLAINVTVGAKPSPPAVCA